ncbi:hypothetical protein [Microcystis sp. LE19-195.1E]|uniref:hypothetical protein n=1 Tax=Microcystis sp. LE19-195.1E TaxID=3016440 RepID=UPI00258AE594|nr:hypothetical protein [Microcystis sp. LE19-195.1E]
MIIKEFRSRSSGDRSRSSGVGRQEIGDRIQEIIFIYSPHFPTSPLPHFPTSPLPHHPTPCSSINKLFPRN